MNREQSKEGNEKAKTLLEGVGKELVAAGFTVNWSADTESDEPELVVNGTCLVRPGLSEKTVLGKFWDHEDSGVRSGITRVLGSRIRFADHCFNVGGPSIGESLK